MKLAAVLLCLASVWAVGDDLPPPRPADFRYQRALTVSKGSSDRESNACASLDATVFAHGAASLADLRLFSGQSGSPQGEEIPYALTLSETTASADAAQILNPGLTGANRLSFDLAMPSRAYSAVDLSLDAQDFLATAKVTGLKSLDDRRPVTLATETLFDLSAQHLGRSTRLSLPESTLPFLHVELAVSQAPGQHDLVVKPPLLLSASVPPSRQAQTLFTEIAATSAFTQRGRTTVAKFDIPAHVPVERVTFSLAPGETSNFSREVRVVAKEVAGKREEEGAVEEVSGTISRVRLTEAGKEVREEMLSVPAILGVNAQQAATVEVSVANQDDRPLRLESVRLEMRERKVCFDARVPAVLYYGAAPSIGAPGYDFARLFNAAGSIRPATLGAEQLNPGFAAPVPAARSFTERHPGLIWVALFAVVGALGLVALRSAKGVG